MNRLRTQWVTEGGCWAVLDKPRRAPLGGGIGREFWMLRWKQPWGGQGKSAPSRERSSQHRVWNKPRTLRDKEKSSVATAVGAEEAESEMGWDRVM